MTTVRIVPARHIRPARAPDGSDVPDWRLHQRLIVLADDAGHRAVPLWLVAGHKELLGRLGRPAADAEVASGLLETAVRLLGTAGTEVSAVDIEPASDDVPELRWDTVTARVGLATATGTRAGDGKRRVRPGAGRRGRGAGPGGRRGDGPARGFGAGRGHAGAVPAPGGRPAAGPPRQGGVSSRGTWRSPRAWTTGNWLAASPMTASGRAGLLLHRRGPVRGLGRHGPGTRRLGRPRPGHRRRGLPRPHGHLPRTAAHHRPGRPGRAAPGRERAAVGIDGYQAPARPRQQPDRPGQQRLDLA